MDARQKPVDHLPEKPVLDCGEKHPPHALVGGATVGKKITAAVDGELVTPLHEALADVQRDLLGAGVAMRDSPRADEGDPHSVGSNDAPRGHPVTAATDHDHHFSKLR